MLLAFLNYTTIGHVTSKHLGSNAVTYNIIGLNTFFSSKNKNRNRNESLERPSKWDFKQLLFYIVLKIILFFLRFTTEF